MDPATSAMTVLIADDHWVVRESLKQVTRTLDSRFRTEEAASFDEALAALEQNPDIGLLLIDLIMPGFHEFEGLQLLRSRYPGVPVVIISVHEDPDYVMRAIQHGVVGYIPKSAQADAIEHALRRVLAGEVAFPRDIITKARPADSAAPSPQQDPVKLAGIDALTHREVELLCELGQGRSVAEISETLAISRQTVRVHLGNAMRKLQIETREAAVRFAIQHLDTLRSAMAGS